MNGNGQWPALSSLFAFARIYLGSASPGSGLPYTTYTLNLLNGSLIPRTRCCLRATPTTPATYIVHAPSGSNNNLALPGLNEFFIACTARQALILNARRGAVIGTVSVCASPRVMVEQDLGGSGVVYVANAISSNISAISTETGVLVATIPLPAGSVPAGLALGPRGADLFVTDSSTETVLVVSTVTRTVASSIKGGAPGGRNLMGRVLAWWWARLEASVV